MGIETFSSVKRKALSKKTRFEVLKRDGFKCQYCGASAPDVRLQVDHIKPVAHGGSDAIRNLVTSCQPCNIGKATSTLSVEQEFAILEHILCSRYRSTASFDRRTAAEILHFCYMGHVEPLELVAEIPQSSSLPEFSEKAKSLFIEQMGHSLPFDQQRNRGVLVQ